MSGLLFLQAAGLLCRSSLQTADAQRALCAENCQWRLRAASWFGGGGSAPLVKAVEAPLPNPSIGFLGSRESMLMRSSPCARFMPHQLLLGANHYWSAQAQLHSDTTLPMLQRCLRVVCAQGPGTSPYVQRCGGNTNDEKCTVGARKHNSTPTPRCRCFSAVCGLSAPKCLEQLLFVLLRCAGRKCHNIRACGPGSFLGTW